MKNTISIVVCLLLSRVLVGQTIYDETKVPTYILPDALKLENGQPVNSVAIWEQSRRAELLSLFSQYVYGQTPGGALVSSEVTSIDTSVFGMSATRKEIILYLSADRSRQIHVLIYLPNNRKKTVPVFLGLNYPGNQAISEDPGIGITTKWTKFAAHPGFPNGYANEKSRGFSKSRWPVELILSRGYGLVTAYYGDLELDRPDIQQSADSFHHWFEKQTGIRRNSSSWGAIGIWAWGISRIIDYLEEDSDIDSKRVAVVGHSRLGKTVLWAAAQDQRIALAISNDSGEGGAALARRLYGERIQNLNTTFPHWFCDNFKQFNGKESELPVDFHQLLSLIAPRPLYIASASGDRWADPKGEYSSLYHAGKVYQLYGYPALQNPEPPSVGEKIVIGKLGYHIRSGKHDITSYDWECFLDFADKNL